MTKSYFECHITISGDPVEREVISERVQMIGWTFSAIDGDIVLGGGVKYYATKHLNVRKFSQESAVEHVKEAAQLLGIMGVTVTRRKVELVVYDDRSDKVRPCEGGCYGCHLDDLVASS